MSPPVLATSGLSVRIGEHTLLAEVSLRVHPGQVLAVIGESGSGKTTLGLALLGEHRRGIELAGSVRLNGAELLELPNKRRRMARSGAAGYLPQHPAAVLNPVRRIGPVLREYAALRHRDRAARRTAVADALRGAQLPASPELLRKFPHQLSGGQQQRVALAQAMITRPDVLVLDEPTTGLDTITKAETAEQLARLVAGGTAVVLLTHDLPLARALAHETAVLHAGRVIEHGPGVRPLHEPTSAHGRRMLDAEPRRRDAPEAGGHGDAPGGLRVRGLGHRAATGEWLVRGLDLWVPAGNCLGVVGCSGAGKTTLARCLTGLTPASEGQVLLDGIALPASIHRRGRAQRRQVQYVHQDARASFDEYRPVTGQVARTAQLLRGLPAEQAGAQALKTLESLGLRREQTDRRPAELSGGQLQRAALARALLARPAVLVCDEITAALDVLNQAQLLDMLARIRSTSDMSVVLISHDLAVVSAIADDICLLDGGRCAELAPAPRLLDKPESATARQLVAATHRAAQRAVSRT